MSDSHTSPLVSVGSFKTFYELNENIDFNKLPNDPPYGFWIKNDEIIQVNGPGGHFIKGKEYLQSKGIPVTNMVHHQMYKLGFVRCVFEVLDDIFYINRSDTTPRSSIKTAEDIADFYGVRCIVTKDEI